MKKILVIGLFIIFLSYGVFALDACSDSNEIDISEIPCLGLTNVVSCTGNVSITNVNTSLQINVTTETTLDNRLNFTVNLTEGSYSFVDCNNNTATVIVGLFQQGYGINLFIIILPAVILSFIILFFSWRMFESLNESEREHLEILESGEDSEDFVPRNRLLPIIFLLFSFIPIIFMIGFVSNNLTKYIGEGKISTLYYNFFIGFSWIFIGIFLLMFVVWLSGFIKKIRINRGIEYE
jgi:hypothetical protein